MLIRFCASCVLLVAAAAGQDTGSLKQRAIKLNGDLEAEMVSLARDAGGHNLTATIRITNKGEGKYSLVFFGPLAAVDDTDGVQFQFHDMTGAAFCEMSPGRLCAGIPDAARAFPLNAYTQIDGGRSITVLMRFALYHGEVSKGDLISLSGEMAYRLGSANDVEFSDRQKLKDVHLGNLSFDRVRVRER